MAEFGELFCTAADVAGAVMGAVTGTESVAANLAGNANWSVPGLAAIAPVYQAAMLMARRGQVEVLPNLHFAANGHDETPSPVTKRYLQTRAYKQIGAGIWGVAGAASSIPAQNFDGFSAVRHINAGASTGVHIYRLLQIAKRYRQSQTIAEWCNRVLKAKYAKAGIRGAQLAGSLIPIPGAQAALGGAAALASVATTKTFNGTCMAAAAEIHWRAFQETTVAGRTGGGTGPATQIMNELFRRRGATRVLGSYDVAALIREPGGWMAVGDKILLI